MKNLCKKTLFIVIIVAILLSVVSCGQNVLQKDTANTEKLEGLWKDATYTENTEIGKGAKTLAVTVTAEEKNITFTVHTDKETLGDALLEHKLVSGEEGPYGLYVKTVNGIYADYDTTNSYWAVNRNGEYMTWGVDDEKIKDGAIYEFIYTKN